MANLFVVHDIQILTLCFTEFWCLHSTAAYLGVFPNAAETYGDSCRSTLNRKVQPRAANMRLVMQRTSEEKHRSTARQDVLHRHRHRAGVFHCSFLCCQGAWPHMIRTSVYTEMGITVIPEMCISNQDPCSFWGWQTILTFLSRRTGWTLRNCRVKKGKCDYLSMSFLLDVNK